MSQSFHESLKEKIHEFVSQCYDITKQFPKSELYGSVSQLRRASLSIMLNYVEGYGRRRDKVKLNFYEISHGSSQECKYLLYFAQSRDWIDNEQYHQGLEQVNEVGKMLWSTINALETKIHSE